MSYGHLVSLGVHTVVCEYPSTGGGLLGEWKESTKRNIQVRMVVEENAVKIPSLPLIPRYICQLHAPSE